MPIPQYWVQVFSDEPMGDQWSTILETNDEKAAREKAQAKADLAIPARVLTVTIERFPAYPANQKPKKGRD